LALGIVVAVFTSFRIDLEVGGRTMKTICPRCHLNGKRVEMRSTFVRYEKEVADVPCDAYPDGTVVTEVKQTVEAPVFRFECPVCGLAVERRYAPETPAVPESP
jgi:predicted RNA-binding Zn-ribbon protein involved in translation (DUF1610 family)